MLIRWYLFLSVVLCLMSGRVTAQKIWQPTNGPYGGQITTLTLSPNGSIYATTQNHGIFVSSDEGNTWSRPLNDTSAIFDSAGRIFAGLGHTGIFRSTNNGVSWQPIDSGLIKGRPYYGPLVGAIAID